MFMSQIADPIPELKSRTRLGRIKSPTPLQTPDSMTGDYLYSHPHFSLHPTNIVSNNNISPIIISALCNGICREFSTYVDDYHVVTKISKKKLKMVIVPADEER